MKIITFVLSSDEPGKPGRPELKNWDKDFVDLEWRPPASDGGAPIEKYIIQMRDKEGRHWIDAAKVSGERTAGRVTDGIQEGHEYEFRIVAVNKAGPSEPSDTSKSVVAKPRFRKFEKSYRFAQVWSRKLQKFFFHSGSSHRPKEFIEESHASWPNVTHRS